MTYLTDAEVFAIVPDVDAKSAPIGYTVMARRPVAFVPYELVILMEDGPHFPIDPLDFYTKTPDGWIKHEGQ